MAAEQVTVEHATPTGRPPVRRFAVRGLVAVVVVALAATAAWLLRSDEPPLPGIAREPALSVEGLEFVDYADGRRGEVVDLVPSDGDVTLAYFGFMNCPDVCPTTLADIRVALSKLGPDRADDVTVAFVTVDPERDEGNEMRDYLELFYRDLPNGRAALRADGPTTLDDAVDQLNVYFEIEDHEVGEERYDVGHSAITYVVDDTGTVVRELPFGATSDEFARIIDHVLAAG